MLQPMVAPLCSLPRWVLLVPLLQAEAEAHQQPGLPLPRVAPELQAGLLPLPRVAPELQGRCVSRWWEPYWSS